MAHDAGRGRPPQQSIDIDTTKYRGARLETGSLDVPTDGTVLLTGATPRRAELTVDSAASFGSGSVINGYIEIAGDSRIEFAGSKQFTGLAGTLYLDGPNAIVADASISGTTNSALRGLHDIGGKLDLFEGAQLSFAGRLTVEKAGDLVIGTGSALTEAGALTIVGQMLVYGQLHLGSSLSNQGTVIVEQESSTEPSALDIAGPIHNDGKIIVQGQYDEVGTALDGTGQVMLTYGTAVTVDSSVGYHQVFRLSQSSTLTLEDAEHFAGHVRYFTHGDSFVLSDFGAGTAFNFTENASHSAGVLSLSDGTREARIFVGGNYTDADFSLTEHTGGVTIASTR